MIAPHRARVLVVDDNKPMRTLVRDMLCAVGFQQSHEAGSVAEASMLLRSMSIDLLITDLIMSGENGLFLVKRVRKGLGPTDVRVPIIAMSGHSEITWVSAAKVAGVDSFLVKPISAATLTQHVAHVLTPADNAARFRSQDCTLRDRAEL